MIEHGNGETENQGGKAAPDVHRAFQDGNSLVESVVILPAMPRIGFVAVVFVLCGLGWNLREPRRGRRRLLGICFWREGLEAAFGPERRGEKRGGAVAGSREGERGVRGGVGIAQSRLVIDALKQFRQLMRYSPDWDSSCWLRP